MSVKFDILQAAADKIGSSVASKFKDKGLAPIVNTDFIKRVEMEGLRIAGLFAKYPSGYVYNGINTPEINGQTVTENNQAASVAKQMIQTRCAIVTGMHVSASADMYFNATHSQGNSGANRIVGPNSPFNFAPNELVYPKDFIGLFLQGLVRPTPATITTFGAILPGSSYMNGTYTNILLTGGNGSGARATIIVTGGVVTAVALTYGGSGYLVGDVLTAHSLNLGGTGSGFAVLVSGVVGNKVIAVSSISAVEFSADLNFGADKRIYVIGDSNTESGAIAPNVYTSNVTADDSWHWKLRNYYRLRGFDVRIIDKARGGLSTVDYEKFRQVGRLDLPEAPHLVVLALGTNDPDAAICGQNYSTIMKSMLSKWPKTNILAVGPPPRQSNDAQMVLNRAAIQSAVSNINRSNVAYVNGGAALDVNNNAMFSGTEVVEIWYI